MTDSPLFQNTPTYLVTRDPLRYYSTKKYGHELGMSCAFRQWRARSHCRFIHGYPLAFEFVFSASELDENNWVIDFGGMKSMKAMLEEHFDHKTIVAQDDPEMRTFESLHALSIIDIKILPAVGMEKVAEYVFGLGEKWLIDNGHTPRVRLELVQVWEHNNNSAMVARRGN
jgi:6-pyruvoyltetrahydropterin/6-carboxytetrahydropterin synthase